MTWLIAAAVSGGGFILVRLGAYLVLVKVLTIAVWALSALVAFLLCLTGGVLYQRSARRFPSD